MDTLQETAAALFRGTHAKQIDSKNRVGIPKPFRLLIPDNGEEAVWLVKGLDPQDRYLEIWPSHAWDRFCEEANRMPGAQRRRKLLRGYVSQAIACKLDAQGRIVIPPYYREFAGLAGDILWIGSGNMMELWAKDRFEARDDDLRNEAYQVLMENDDHFTG